MVNSAEEWTLTAGESSHPFHIHVNPFQIVSRTDSKGNTTVMNVWRDTLYINEWETYRIRSRFLDFAGLSVFHCHILDHEDQGMMMPLKFFKQNEGLPAQVICKDLQPPATKLLSSAIPAPPMTLVDVGGSSRELTSFQPHNVALVFFQGAECSHCAAALADLLRQIRETVGLNVEIVAVSSRRVADQARTLKSLGALASDKFHLFVDESHGTFRDFGCYSGGPRHGVFLVDESGVIRYKYVGERPFGDTRQVVERLRELSGTSLKKLRLPLGPGLPAASEGNSE
jgi:peroxiredoxin